MSEFVKWACPNCGAGSDSRDGFYCYCDGGTSDHHGESADDPCLDAECRCGWKGTFPPGPSREQRLASLLREALGKNGPRAHADLCARVSGLPCDCWMGRARALLGSEEGAK